MGEAEETSQVTAPPRPTISLTLPPRPSMETLFDGGPGLSPGPMTLVSNFFSEYYPDSDSCSFSQLLAGAMASPVGRPNLLSGNSSKEMNSGDGSDKKMGFKQNRPMNLVVAQSPLFMMPPGLSPSGLLNSPGFFSPRQVCRDHLRLEILRSQELMPGPLTNCKRWCIQGTYDLTFPFEAGSRISCKQAYLE